MQRGTVFHLAIISSEIDLRFIRFPQALIELSKALAITQFQEVMGQQRCETTQSAKSLAIRV